MRLDKDFGTDYKVDEPAKWLGDSMKNVSQLQANFKVEYGNELRSLWIGLIPVINERINKYQEEL